MVKIILTRCQNQKCNKDFGVPTLQYEAFTDKEYFKVNCPYCKYENNKRGIGDLIKSLN